VKADTQKKDRGYRLLKDQDSESVLMGLRFPFLPDFLKDNSLLGEAIPERLHEHCQRWVQFVESLWREEDITYSLGFLWTPNCDKKAGASGELLVAQTPSFTGIQEGESRTDIFLLIRYRVDSAASGKRNPVSPLNSDSLRTELGQAAKAFGFAVDWLTEKELESFSVVASESYGYEVRQREVRMPINLAHVERYYDKDLDIKALSFLKRGAYAVQPWLGPAGAFLVPFETLSTQSHQVLVLIVLKPQELKPLLEGQLNWLEEWASRLEKLADDNGSPRDSSITTNIEADTEFKETKNSTVVDVAQTTSSKTYKAKFCHEETDGENRKLVSVTDTTPLAKSRNETTVYPGKQSTTTIQKQEVKGAGSFSSKDPGARWLARDLAANARRLGRPFLLRAFCLSKDSDAAKQVAQAITGMVSETPSFFIPPGEEQPRESRAEYLRLEPSALTRALELTNQLTMPREGIETETLLQEAELQDWPWLRNLPYLVDARGAATLFRFPVSVSGGVAGVEVRQRPPDFHPGVRRKVGNAGTINLGELHSGGLLNLPVNDLIKHVLVTGFTGSGKTNTIIHILQQLKKMDKPFLVIETAKKEYRGLLNVLGFKADKKLRIYTLGDETTVPFRINPFALLPGVRVETHIARLRTCFEAAMPSLPWIPSILGEALGLIYAQHGWRYFHRGTFDGGNFPRMPELCSKMLQIIKTRHYSDNITQDVMAATETRLKPLLIGSLGRMFDTSKALPDGFFTNPVVLELNDLNPQDRSLVTMFLLTFLREHREQDAIQHPIAKPDDNELTSLSWKLRHVTVVEEAHNIMGRVVSHEGSEVTADTRAQAVEAFCQLLAEVRALGEGMIIADQSPSKLAPDAMRNTNLHIAHQLRDGRDREAIALAMIMEPAQQEFLAKLEEGQASVFYTGLQKATFLRVPNCVLKDTRLTEPLQRWHGYAPATDENVITFMSRISSSQSQIVLFRNGEIHRKPNPECDAPDCQENCEIYHRVRKAANDPDVLRSFERILKDLVLKPDSSVSVWDSIAYFAWGIATGECHYNVMPRSREAARCFFIQMWTRISGSDVVVPTAISHFERAYDHDKFAARFQQDAKNQQAKSPATANPLIL